MQTRLLIKCLHDVFPHNSIKGQGLDPKITSYWTLSSVPSVSRIYPHPHTYPCFRIICSAINLRSGWEISCQDIYCAQRPNNLRLRKDVRQPTTSELTLSSLVTWSQIFFSYHVNFLFSGIFRPADKQRAVCKGEKTTTIAE